MASNLPRIGELDHRVLLMKNSMSRNDFNEDEKDLAAMRSMWVKREDTTGTEELDNGTIIAVQGRKYTGHYRSDINTTMVIKDGAELWDIQFKAVLGRNQYVELRCVRRE